MRYYDNNLWLKFVNFSTKKKINFVLSYLGIKTVVYFLVYTFLSFFLNNNMPFIRRVIFNILKKKSEYVFVENNKKEKFILFSYDKVISQEIFTQSEFDLSKLYQVLEILKRDYEINKIYDIGANIGTICIPAVKRGLVQKAIGIEPEPQNYKLLKMNIILNNLENNIKIYNTALSSENEKTMLMELSTDNSGDHRIRTDQVGDDVYDEKKRKTIDVSSKTFDSMFPTINRKHDLIWIDTQGHEAKILSGANNLITSGAPVVMEFWPYALKRSNSFGDLKKIIVKFKYFYDLSDSDLKKIKVTSSSIDLLFSGWKEEKKTKENFALFTDLLLLS